MQNESTRGEKHDPGENTFFRVGIDQLSFFGGISLCGGGEDKFLGGVRECCPLLGGVAGYVLLLACFFLWFWWGEWDWLGWGAMGYGFGCCNVSGALSPQLLARRGGLDYCFFAGAGCCSFFFFVLVTLFRVEFYYP